MGTLGAIELRLAEIAKSESTDKQRPEDADTRSAMMPVRINESDPLLVQSIRKELRTRHYSLRTESAYIGWAVRFM